MDVENLKRVRLAQKANPTKFELLFRQKLRKWKMKFKEQKIISGYIADFFLPQYGLIIEIDGEAHYKYKTVRDGLRDETLRRAGYQVHRIRNSEVFQYEKEDILNVINNFAQSEIKDRSFFSNYLAKLWNYS